MFFIIKLAIALGIVVVLLAAALLWELLKLRQRERTLREQGSDRIIRSEHLSSKETGHWNIT